MAAGGNPNDPAVSSTGNQTFWWCDTADEWAEALLSLSADPNAADAVGDAQRWLYWSCERDENVTGSPVCSTWHGKYEAAKLIINSITCDDPEFLDEVYILSEDNLLGYMILKIYQPIEMNRTDILLECRGRMVWTDGDETQGRYYIEIDRDGDLFVGYEPFQG